MKAWHIPAANELELIDIEKPQKPVGTQVLVKIISCCICNGSDPGIFNGNAGYGFPMVFGHEAGGIIEAVGENVKDFKIGDRVCWWCTIGVFTEYMIVDTNSVAMFIAPENLENIYTSALELVIASSRALMPFIGEDNKLKEEYKNKTLLILGMGPSGLVAAQFAKYLGFGKIYGWDLYKMRRELALKLGVDMVLDPSAEDFAEKVKLQIKDSEANLALDMMDDDLLLPKVNTFNYLITAMKNHGTIVSYGHPEHGRVFRGDMFQGKNLNLVCPENNLVNIRKRGEIVMQAIKDGAIKVEPLVTHKYKFDKVKEVFYSLLKNPGEYIKVVFDF